MKSIKVIAGAIILSATMAACGGHADSPAESEPDHRPGAAMSAADSTNAQAATDSPKQVGARPDTIK